MSESFALENITDERTARIALSYATPLDHPLTGSLVQRFGGVQALQFALGQVPAGIDENALKIWRSYFERYDPVSVARGLDLADANEITLLMPTDRAWPTGLDDLGSSKPVTLWVRGSRPELLERLPDKRVTIAGPRAASGGGMYDADHLSVALANLEITIVATSAPGIPRAALAGSLYRPGGAIAVFSHGLDTPNADTPNGFFDKIAENGLLISETPPGLSISRDSLLGRRRLVAAMSYLTTSFEAGPRGETAQTVNIAKGIGRRVVTVSNGEPLSASRIPSQSLHLTLDLATKGKISLLDHLESFARKQAFVEAVAEPRTSETPSLASNPSAMHSHQHPRSATPTPGR